MRTSSETEADRVKDSPYRVRPLRILYGVSSVGLGHVRRSLAIVSKLRELNPGVDLQLDWVAAEPALTFLQKNNERTLEICPQLESLSVYFEKNTTHGKISDMSRVTSEAQEGAKRNYGFIKPFLTNYDLLIQDEFVETLLSFLWDKEPPPIPSPKTIVLTDYVAFDTESSNPLNKLKISFANRMLKKAYLNQQLRIFLDTPDALPENSGERKWVAENFHVLGPVIQTPPAESKTELTKKLVGQTQSVRFVVFTVGGTAIGKSLVQFLVKNADFLSERLDAYLVVLLGSRIKPEDLKDVESTRITLVPFTLDSTKYFKVAECVVSQAGASSLYEVASLGLPCVVIPIENHFEQQQNAERFSDRFGFEILQYKELSIVSLQNAVSNALKADKYEPLAPTKAAQSVARLVYDLVGL
jgi:predicted glycosyltransferase